MTEHEQDQVLNELLQIRSSAEQLAMYQEMAEQKLSRPNDAENIALLQQTLLQALIKYGGVLAIDQKALELTGSGPLIGRFRVNWPTFVELSEQDQSYIQKARQPR